MTLPTYAGLGVEFPITIRRMGESSSDGGKLGLSLLLDTEDVETRVPYPGHLLVATLYTLESTGLRQRLLVSTRIVHSASRTELALEMAPLAHNPVLLGVVAVKVETNVPLGHYEDFLVTRLAAVSDAFRVSLGFR